ncbi:MAG: prepilin-type N-terminal cleavage/methylation domain-containing protein [Lachnospiraceae bacterium]|nr:prepilin-type N-terminal cleavage/methylation domain-containing protein [Lachnospiraceae bacterium]
MRKIRESGKNNIRNIDDHGFTLVEMVVTFALLGIFLVAVTRMISYTVTLYHETQGTALGMQVTDTIAARIQGVIEDAEEFYPSFKETGGFNAGGDDFILLKDGNGVRIKIYAEDGGIIIRYNEVISEDDEGNETVVYEQHDWKFDEKAYMGYTVKDIEFAFAQTKFSDYDYPVDIIHMELTLESAKYGEYTAEYYIKASKVQ